MLRVLAIQYLSLMQVYLPAIAGHVLPQMVLAISNFLDFCYLVRCAVITEETLDQIQAALTSFHKNQVIFYDSGVRPTGFLLPRQHSMVHYRRSIQLFGAPNGLCSSITESKHIKAVKEPWRRSSHFQALGQMLLTNQHLDKLTALRVDFTARGMLRGPCLAPHLITPVAIPAYPPVNAPGPQREPGEDDHTDGSGAIAGPHVLNHVTLSRNPGL